MASKIKSFNSDGTFKVSDTTGRRLNIPKNQRSNLTHDQLFQYEMDAGSGHYGKGIQYPQEENLGL